MEFKHHKEPLTTELKLLQNMMKDIKKKRETYVHNRKWNIFSYLLLVHHRVCHHHWVWDYCSFVSLFAPLLHS